MLVVYGCVTDGPKTSGLNTTGTVISKFLPVEPPRAVYLGGFDGLSHDATAKLSARAASRLDWGRIRF